MSGKACRWARKLPCRREAAATQPREIAHYNTWDATFAESGAFTGALGIRVVDGLIYVADSERGLVILRETL